jgi:hypothetical protein
MTQIIDIIILVCSNCLQLVYSFNLIKHFKLSNDFFSYQVSIFDFLAILLTILIIFVKFILFRDHALEFKKSSFAILIISPWIQYFYQHWLFYNLTIMIVCYCFVCYFPFMRLIQHIFSITILKYL